MNSKNIDPSKVELSFKMNLTDEDLNKETQYVSFTLEELIDRDFDSIVEEKVQRLNIHDDRVVYDCDGEIEGENNPLTLSDIALDKVDIFIEDEV